MKTNPAFEKPNYSKTPQEPLIIYNDFDLRFHFLIAYKL